MFGFAGLAARVFLVAVFTSSGAAKLGHRREVALAVERYEFIPALPSRAVGTVLAPVELALAALLALGVWPALVGVAVLAVLSVFTMAVGVALLRGRAIDCGCGSSSIPERIGWAQVARNLVYLLVAGVAIAAGLRAGTADGLPGRMYPAALILGFGGWSAVCLVAEAWRYGSARARLDAAG